MRRANGWGAAHSPRPANLALRLGLKYISGLRDETARAIERTRVSSPFNSIADFSRRVAPNSRELSSLAYAGAFSSFGLTRREALWQAAAVERDPTSLLARATPRPSKSPLPEMSALDTTRADYAASGVTIGPHLMAYLRESLKSRGVLSAAELTAARDGTRVQVAGVVIVRQRPGTAKGFLFLTLEDETGIANAIVMPDMFQRNRALINRASILMVAGPVQNRDGVIHVKADRFTELSSRGPLPPSHDYR